jgi:hypothetical protein
LDNHQSYQESNFETLFEFELNYAEMLNKESEKLHQNSLDDTDQKKIF